jgi:hypothetical protein
VTRKQRKYGGGGKALGMAKHRQSGRSGPSRRTKEWLAREINAMAPRRYSARMYGSIRELMRGRDG